MSNQISIEIHQTTPAISCNSLLCGPYVQSYSYQNLAEDTFILSLTLWDNNNQKLCIFCCIVQVTGVVVNSVTVLCRCFEWSVFIQKNLLFRCDPACHTFHIRILHTFKSCHYFTYSYDILWKWSLRKKKYEAITNAYIMISEPSSVWRKGKSWTFSWPGVTTCHLETSVMTRLRSLW